jgi:hypothetical protein
MTRSSIFTITAAGDDVQHLRTWGWYPKFDLAVKHVLEGDDTLLESGTYKYLLIEEVPVGCFTICEKQWWFRAEYIPWRTDGHSDPQDTYKVTICETPDWAKNATNFSMG